MAKQSTIKESRANAEKILLEIEEILSTTVDLKEKINQELDSSIQENKKLQKIRPRIKSTIEAATDSIDELRSQRDKLKTTLNSTQKFLEKNFDPIQTLIDDPSTGLKYQVKTAKKLLESSQKLNKKQQSLVNQISSVKKESTELIADIRRKHRSIDGIVKLGKIKEEKILDTEQKIISKEKIVSDYLTRIKDANDSVVKNDSEVAKILTKVEENSETIESNLSQSEINLEKIRTFYEIAMNSGLGGEFDARRKKLNNNSIIWLIQIIFCVSLICTLIIGLAYLQYEEDGLEGLQSNIVATFFLRLLLVSPIVYYLYFCVSQFRRLTIIAAKYSHKAALALSIESHMNLLLNTLPGDKDSKEKIVEFVLKSFNKIHEEPFKEKSKRLDKLPDDVIEQVISSLENH